MPNQNHKAILDRVSWKNLLYFLALWILVNSSDITRADGIPESNKKVKFNRDIKPILADKCLACHGVDEHDRQGDLQLDNRQAAIDAGAIQPGELASSKLVERIHSTDPDAVMPPPDSHKALTPAEKQLFEKWILEGAEYEIHWAFEQAKTPAITYMQTGNMVTGRPCIGSWISYGLWSMNENLPTFVVLVAQPTNKEQIQAISARLWSSGYLPGEHAGVNFRSSGDPILYINNPDGLPTELRRTMLDGLRKLNEHTLQKVGDPETHTRIQQYELAFRMQSSVPDLTSIADEPESTYQLYGDAAKTPGTFANTVLMARRMIERDVRFVQVYLNNWDHHGNVAGRLPMQCKDIDQPTYGLITDLKQRGLLDSTLIIWGGEFGRTIYSQGGLSKTNYGRDQHPRCFTMWMAGGGAKGGTIHGETDDFSYNIVKDPVHVRDLHATVLKLLGIDHQRFSFKHLGLDNRLTGVEPARVIPDLIQS